MKNFLQKVFCKLGRHVQPTAVANPAINDHGEQVVRIWIHCPVCLHSMMWIDVGNEPPRYTRRGESLH